MQKITNFFRVLATKITSRDLMAIIMIVSLAMVIAGCGSNHSH